MNYGPQKLRLTLHRALHLRVNVARRRGALALLALLLGVGLFWMTPFGAAQTLDESWTLTVAGQSVQANSDGSVRIQNISAADLFGVGGPGTAPDFVSDNFVRLTGVQNKDGVTRYVFSEPFLFRARQTFVISNLTFTDFPPPLPVSIRAQADQATLTSLNQTTQVRVIAKLGDGSTLDVSPRTRWTSYRTSNPGIATVDGDGLLTSRTKGMVFVTAINEGATSVSQVDVSPGDPLTTVIGFVQTINGVPVADATVRLAGGAAFAITDATGRFTIRDVATQLGLSNLVAYKLGEGLLFGSKSALTLVPGGVTDAGIILMDGNCATCPDQDRDGLPDDLEIALGTDRTRPDTDGDGIKDWFELVFTNTDPLRRITNADGIQDGQRDPDGDGLTNLQEQASGTNPLLFDSDDDLWDDAAEINAGSNPTDFESTPNLHMVVANPSIQVVAPGLGTLDGVNAGVVVANPQVTVLVPGLGEIGPIGLGVVVARPALDVLIPGIGPFDFVGLGTLVARPQVTVLAPGLGTIDAVGLGTVVARPPLDVLIPGIGSVESIGLGTLVAQPQVTVLAPGLGVVDSVGLGTVVAQPPVTVLVPGLGDFDGFGLGTMIALPPVNVKILGE